MDLARVRDAVPRIAPTVIGLVVFGVFFQRVLVALASAAPREIYFAPSFSIALFERNGVALAIGIASVAFVLWLLSPQSRGRFSWTEIDRVGGLRWLILGIAMTLAWAYSGYRYNYYYNQAHLWDRWLVVVLMIATLRSPLLIPAFVFEVLLSRGQFEHPISAATPIGDEFPLRVLGIVVGAALSNGVLDGVESLRSKIPRVKALLSRFEDGLKSWRIDTHALVFAILCMTSFYYAVAAVGKISLGAQALDWMRFSHMENLFVASHLNGWLTFLPESRFLELAEIVRLFHLPITVFTLACEFGMAFLLVRRRGTLLLLAAVSSMHIGILITSGIIFWKWLVLDVALLVWLWVRREDPEILRMYSRSNALLSLVVVAGMIAAFSTNVFSWWNTEWTMTYEVEVIDTTGESYRVDYADFKPYTLFDLYKPDGRDSQTYAFGMTKNQRLMEYMEAPDPRGLERFASSEPASEVGPDIARGARVFRDFMKRYFTHRNRHPNRRAVPFLLPSPAMHNRSLAGPDVYRDQNPVVEVRLRFREIYYTGSGLENMRDEIVYSIPIRVRRADR